LFPGSAGWSLWYSRCGSHILGNVVVIKSLC
jgi:hypothetical protein